MVCLSNSGRNRLGFLSVLKREEKEAVVLLQMGTFLEYFDLLLYVHMAVLLNELFFPKTDPHTAELLAAFAFCSTFVLRPFGALIFGYLGDTIGRKTTVIITTILMSMSCMVMANLPTYEEVGIIAAWLVTACRAVQGLSSMGEVIGAQIYVSELVRPPAQYVAVSFIGVASIAGGVVALGVASLVTRAGLDWRIAFWMGATVAVIGSIARIRLRETPEFVDMKSQFKKKIEELGSNKIKSLKIRAIKESLSKIQVKKQTYVAYFLAYCGWPLSFYLGFIYFNPILKSRFWYSAGDIILHNFYLSILPLISFSVWSVLSYKIHPLKILRKRAEILLLFTLFLPFCISNATHHFQIFLIQAILLVASMGDCPASSVFVKHFPVFKRFTAASFVYALSRAIMHVITSFSLVYLTELFGYYGLWLIMIPVILGHLWGIQHFKILEEEQLPNESALSLAA